MSTKVLGVLGGGDVDEVLLERWVRSADAVFAADGAANRLFQMGVPFQVVVGDMDSVAAWALSATEVVHIPDQDTTDCDKLLAYCHARGFESITLAGVEGDLPDHVLATLQSCLRSPLETRLAYRTGIGWVFGAGAKVEVDCAVGARVSLLPLSDCKGVELQGVAWPLIGADLSAHGLTSISNSAASTRLTVSLETGGALLFVSYPTDRLPLW